MHKFTKIFLILFCLVLFSNQETSAKTKFIKGDFYEGKIKWKKLEIDLPAGRWEYIKRSSWWYGGFGYSCKSFVLKEERLFKSLMRMCEMRTGGKYLGYLAKELNHYYKRGEYDSCTLRPEYYYAKLFLRGTSTNCFRIRHIDFDKEMNYPDDPDDVGGIRPVLRKWIKENNIVKPKILLVATHEYFAPVVSDNGPGVYYFINPVAYGAPEEKYFTEESSEYHRTNINNHPKFKKFIDDFVSLSAKRHKDFEIQWKAKDRHKLDLDEVITINGNSSLVNSEPGIATQIKNLKKLYDEGVLDKEEYERAKDKLLN